MNLKNESVGDIDLNDAIFSVKGGTGTIYEVVKMQQANRRKGCAATRNRALISGTTAKMYRQKGTGRARHGDYKVNIFVGGGKSFGPHPRDYSYQVPKKARRKALRIALSRKSDAKKLIVVDEFSLPNIKTKSFVETLKKLGAENALVVIHDADEKLARSARNLHSAKVLKWEGLNVADLLRFEHVIMTKPALEKVQEVLKP